MPPSAISSSWVPCSATWPPLMTAMVSALRMVLSRWAMVMTVRCCLAMIWSRAAWTTRSLAVSSADVASSRSRMAGLRTTARAIATRCFCPPESMLPRRPTFVRKP
mmetsp:Transcript_5776/g.18419  ORF Transcript_5776/g.18419 Transcript_5776/m.18419 type:complete len:106 (-) Transcript_5776:52-369(-)